MENGQIAQLCTNVKQTLKTKKTKELKTRSGTKDGTYILERKYIKTK